ncbi:MAG: ABC transporter permease [Bacillota bacterium]
MLQLRAFLRLVKVQVLLYMRDPLAVFFSLLLAPALMLMMGFILWDATAPWHTDRLLDFQVPAYAALVIGVVGLATAPIELSTRRATAVLRCFWATPLHPLVYIASDVLAYLGMVALGVFLLFLVGGAVHGVWPEGCLPVFAGGVLLSAGAFLALGYLLASLVPSARVATDWVTYSLSR